MSQITRHGSGAPASRRGAEGGGTVSLASGVPRSSRRDQARRSIEYGQLSPMLRRVRPGGGRRAGRGVRAPRGRAAAVHLVLSLGGLAAAFVLTVVVAASSSLFGGTRPVTSPRRARSPWTGPTLFIQGTILVLAFVSVLLIAESSHDVSPFAAQAAAVPGSPEEREGAAGRHHAHRGLPADPVRGRRHAAVPRGQRPADHVRRARGAVAAAVPALRPGPAPPPALAGGGGEVLPAGRVLLGVLPVRHRLLYGFAGSVRLVGDRARPPRPTPQRRRCCSPGMALVGVGLLFKIGAVPFHGWKPDVYQGAPTPVTALMASCTLVSAFGALLRVFYVAFGRLTWDWRPAMWVVADPDHGGRRDHRDHPDRREAAARLLVDRARRVHPDRRHRRDRGGPVQQPVLPGRVRVHHDRRVRRRDAGPGRRRRGRAPVPLGRPRQALAAGRRGVRLLPARLRRHPADQRVHREVRGLPGRGRRAGRCRW